MFKIKVKPYSAINHTSSAYSFTSYMKSSCDKTLEFKRLDDKHFLVTKGRFKDFVYLSAWLVNPPRAVKPKEYKTGTLVDDYRVIIGDSIAIGCQILSVKQEEKWFKILAKRLGYEIKG